MEGALHVEQRGRRMRQQRREQWEKRKHGERPRRKKSEKRRRRRRMSGARARPAGQSHSPSVAGCCRMLGVIGGSGD